MLLVLAGAGASLGVNKDHYPTTRGFFSRLPATITNKPLFPMALTFLKTVDGRAEVDIEQVLWALGDLTSFAGTSADQGRFAGWMLGDNQRAQAASGVNHDLRPVHQMLSESGRFAKNLVDQINACVYDLYGRLPTPEELEQTWFPLLKRVHAIDPIVEVFTTNYDLVLEQAIDTGRIPISLGRSPGVQPRLMPELWDATHPEANTSARGRLTKLHGSVDWNRGPNAIHVGTPLYHGSHADHVIIYPGYKGTPTEEPFNLFHQHLEASIARASAIIVVGFAFRDPYINEVFRRRTPSGTSVFIIDPNPPSSAPFAPTTVTHVKAGFGLAAVEECLLKLQLALGLDAPAA